MHASKNKTVFRHRIRSFGIIVFFCFILLEIAIVLYERHFDGRIYPNVTVGGVPFGGMTSKDVAAYWKTRNDRFSNTQFQLTFETTIATLSAETLGLGYDENLSAHQAYLVGRSGGILSNLYVIFFRKTVALEPYFRWKTDVVDDELESLADRINIPVEDALFQFEHGKVTTFKPSKNGRMLHIEDAKTRLRNAFAQAALSDEAVITVSLPVDTVQPSVATNDSNAFGIKELIGTGYSEFQGSIPGRVHNVALAASRINGVLIKPGEIFSFSQAVGDISAATGYQSAYIIKDGRTVLGDGGGVCQVSSTLFRAALNAGLPIIERHSHAYRVHYYEEGGFKPGLDATIFSPSVDLKIQNDTGSYILIQTKTDTKNLALSFELYGTRDGRKAEITNHQVWGITPAPPPVYQDDPTLRSGVVKQVDWAAPGTKASFDYTVTRNGETLQKTTFYSNFRPWQAVYLKGTLL